MAAALSIALEGRFGEGLAQVVVFPVAAVFGFIPLFIYGAWLAHNLERSDGGNRDNNI